MSNKADELRSQILDLTKAYYSEQFRTSAFEPGKSKVNYAGRVFDEKELVNLVDSSLDFWLTAGRFTEDFSMKLADFLDVDDVLLVN